MAITFILSDETINSYGYRVRTAGVDLDRFRKNPVLFYSHGSYRMPLGKWENIRVEDDKILADAVFDTKDEEGQIMARKVQDGFLRAASIGLSNARAIAEQEDERVIPTVVACEMYEASIVAIPANKNSIRLSFLDSTLNFFQPTQQHTMKLFEFFNLKKEEQPETVSLAADELNQLRTNAASAKLKFDELSTENASLKAQKTEAEQKLLAAESNAQTLQAQLDALNAEKAQLSAQVATLSTERDALKVEVETLGAAPGDAPTVPPTTETHTDSHDESDEQELAHNQRADELLWWVSPQNNQ